MIIDNKRKRLFENVISLGALQVVSYVIPLINLPYLSRVLSVNNFGLVFFAQAFMWYFMVIVDFGFELSATREISINRHNSKSIANIFNSVMTLKIILLIICYIILLLASILIPKIHDNFILFQLSFLMVIGYTIYPVWFFQGMEKMKYITFLNILAKSVFLILIFIFIKKDSDYILVPLFNSLGFIISGLIGYKFAIKNFNINTYLPKLQSLKKHFNYSASFFLSRLSVTSLSNTNTFCLGLISSNTLVGYFVAAEKICGALKGLQAPIKNAIYPYIAKYKDIKLYKKIFKTAIILNTTTCIFIFVFAKQFIILFYSADMIAAYRILRLFCFVVLITAPSTMLGYPLLGAMGYTKEANQSVIFASIFHLFGLGVLFLTKALNIYSIVYLTFISESVLFIQWSIYVYKYHLLQEGETYVKKNI